MIREAITILVSGESLSKQQASEVMGEIMEGNATPSQIAAFATALRLKGETVDEMAGMALVMREKSQRVSVDGNVVDTCGTGGDGSGTFNISTVAAFVVAGTGTKVAKHGNRAMSGVCGSADVLEEAGVKIDLGPAGVTECLARIGIGFMFAPIFHPSMRHAAEPRRDIGIRTIFNFLGPLTNPAGAQAQVIGVSDQKFGERMAQVLQQLGTQRALVVQGSRSVDELTLEGENHIWELNQDKISAYTIKTEDTGLPKSQLEDLVGGDRVQNAAILKNVLEGSSGPHRDVVMLNASAALLAAGVVPNLRSGIEQAAQSIDSKSALKKLEDLVALSQKLE
jgi:anthranilate phosphoribosyltransferase